MQTLMVRIGAELSGLTRGLDQAQSRIQSFATKMQSQGAAMSAGLTVPLVAAGGAALKTSIDFESAFSNVKKTVKATEPEFAAFEAGIRSMAKEIPKTAVELSNIAAIGGQFGVSTPALMGFTRTVADLSVAIDGISAEEAAASMAQIGKVTGTTEAEFRNMGSTLVDLGNKGSSAEGDILEFTQRLAGAGASVNMSTAEVMGLGAAMANLGLNAEAGGTAMSRVISSMEAAVARGGGELANFANVAGVSAAQFADAFKNEPIKAVQMFIDGLGKAKDSGESLTLVLDQMEMKDVRQVDALKRLAQSHGEVTKQVDIAREAWVKNSALSDEASAKYGTTANQLVVLKNKLVDTGITVGNVFAGQLRDATGASGGLVSKIEEMGKSFAGMDPQWQKAITYTGLFLAVIGPLVWAVGGTVSAIAAFAGALGTMTSGLLGAVGAMASMAPALGIAGLFIVLGGAVYGVAQAIGNLYSSWKSGQSMWDFFTARDDDNFVRKFLGLSSGANEAAAAFKNIPAAATPAVASLGLTAEQAKHAEEQIRRLAAGAPVAAAGLRVMTEAEKEAAKAFQQLVDTMSGKELFKEVSDIVRAVSAIGGVTKLTTDEAKTMAETVNTAIAKYTQLGTQAPPEVMRLAIALDGIVQKGATLINQLPVIGQEIDKAFSSPLPTLFSKGFPGIDKMIEPFKPAGAKASKSFMDGLQQTLSSQLGPTILGALKGGGDVLKSVGGLMGGELAKGLLDKSGGFLSKQLGSTFGGILGSIMPGLGTLAGSLLGTGISKAVGWFKGLFGGGDDKAAEAAKKREDEMKAAAAELEARLKTMRDTAGELQTKFGDAKGELDGLLGKAREMGYVFNEQGELTGVTFDAMKQTAKDLGLDLTALGPAFTQAGLNEKAMELSNKLDLLKLGGANVGGVLFGVKGQVNDLVNESIKLGTTLPANMQPWVAELVRAGLLTDANGDKITDLTSIKFGEPIKSEYEQITDSIKAVIDKMTELMVSITDMANKIAEATAPRTIQIGWNVQPPPDMSGMGGFDLHLPDMKPFATGGVVFGPTNALIGEAGPEAVMPLDRLQSMLDYASGAGNADVVDKLDDMQRTLADLPFMLAKAQRESNLRRT